MKSLKKKDVRIAIIGCGNIANFHVKSFQKIGIKILHCASSLNSKNIYNFANLYKIKNIWNDPVKLAKASNLWDGLILSSTTESIPKLLDILIRQKKPILVEKPVDIGTSYLKKFKNAKNPLIQVAFNRRFYPTVREVQKFIDNSKNELLVKMIIPEKVINIKNKLKRFKHVFENSAHGVDLLYYLFKELKIINISKVFLNSFDSSRIALLRTKKNHKCVLIINSNSPDNFSIEVEDGQNRILLKPFEDIKYYEGLERIDPTKAYPLRRYLPRLIISKNIFNYETKFNDLKPGFYEQSLSFLDLIINKRRNNSASLRDAYNVQNLIEKIMLF